MLREASGALTGEAPNRVHTEELAVVLLGRALVQIFREQRGNKSQRLEKIFPEFKNLFV